MKVSAKHIPLLATTLVCAGLYAIASVAYKNFFSVGVSGSIRAYVRHEPKTWRFDSLPLPATKGKRKPR